MKSPFSSETARSIFRACVALGVVGLAAAAITYVRMDGSAKEHVSAGPFSGLEYAVAQVLAILVGWVSVAAIMVGTLGLAIRRRRGAALRRDARASGDRRG